MGRILSTNIGLRPATPTASLGGEARRPAGAGADQVRAGRQPQDREGPRPRHTGRRARPRRRGDRMRRRAFIATLGGAAAWPLAARAQQQPAKKMLRVGTVSGTPQSSPQWAAFLGRMAEIGYQEGKTSVFDVVPAASEEEYETGYRTLVAREPDIILATGVEIA